MRKPHRKATGINCAGRKTEWRATLGGHPEGATDRSGMEAQGLHVAPGHGVHGRRRRARRHLADVRPAECLTSETPSEMRFDWRSLLEGLVPALRGDRDLASDVLVRMLEPHVLAKYDPDRGSLLDFALGIAKYVRLEESRRSRRRLPTIPLTSALAVAGQCGACRWESHERLSRLAMELERLPGRDRRLIFRRFGLQLAEREALPMNSDERARLSRALRRLRSRLSDVG